MLKVLPTAAIAASLGLGTSVAARAALPAGTAPLMFHYGSSENPILFEGDRIRASRSITSIDFFRPIFGGDRPRVNPARPAVEHDVWLRFSIPGEYYLRFNGEHEFLKVLVLSRAEPLSAAVVRLFDFCVANLLYSSGAHDAHWDLWATRERVIPNWFRSCEPLMISCSPTHAIFRRLVEERFALPARVASFTGTHIYRRKIVHMSHNVPEIYLPDLQRWVMMDVNSAYLVRWEDSISIAAAVHRVWGDRTLKNEDWRQLGLDLYGDVRVHPADPVRYGREVAAAGPRLAFTRRLVRARPLADGDRTRALRIFYSGPVYWGAAATTTHPVGTEFLPGNGAWACPLRTPRLLSAATTALAAFIPIRPMPPALVQRLLDEGHRPVIRQAAWKDRVPELAG